MKPTILSIETSLDDTCAAVTRGTSVLSNIVSSQTSHHAEWGGTVPDIAKRLHQEWLPLVTARALKQAKLTPSDLDAIAVTIGPGLAPSLEQGIDHAKNLSKEYSLPIIPINHLEGHLLSSYATNLNDNGPLTKVPPEYPALGFLISGGHTQLVLMQRVGEYQLLGATLDDAAGEAYDKVARMLGLGYPGGPILAEMARTGSPIYPLREPMTTRRDLDFSFSGLKTQAKYFLEREKPELTKQFILDFSASFQQAVFKHLMRRFRRAIELHSPAMILLGGGVVSNIPLRTLARKTAKEFGIPTHIPYSKKLITDNAAMIGVVASFQFTSGNFVDPDSLDRLPNLNFPTIS
jgi:N6-L-threonylcarbamoyladenine synthase